MIYALYILLAAAVVLLSVKIADYVDMLDKSTKISGAFIGAVLLAAVTSLPELFTSISATLLVGENDLVLGNILGSNLFNFSVMGLSLLVFIRSVHKAKFHRSHLMSLVAMLLMYTLIALDSFFDFFPKIGWFSLSSPLIFIVYLLFLFFTPKVEESTESEKGSVKLSLKQILIRFAVCAVLLIGASIAITYVSDLVAEALDLSKTFAGALLLGVATSLPETASTLSLCKKRNYNAAFGNILGSNLFNCNILVIADLLSFKKGASDVFSGNSDATLLIILGAAVCVLAAALMRALFSEGKRRALKTSVAAVFGVAAISSYVIFTALSIAL